MSIVTSSSFSLFSNFLAIFHTRVMGVAVRRFLTVASILLVVLSFWLQRYNFSARLSQNPLKNISVMSQYVKDRRLGFIPAFLRPFSGKRQSRAIAAPSCVPMVASDQRSSDQGALNLVFSSLTETKRIPLAPPLRAPGNANRRDSFRNLGGYYLFVGEMSV
jgi:hypothetical protein